MARHLAGNCHVQSVFAEQEINIPWHLITAGGINRDDDHICLARFK
jgi:hypothetical protein